MEQYYQDVENKMAADDEADKLFNEATAKFGDYYAFSPDNVVEALGEGLLSKNKYTLKFLCESLEKKEYDTVGRLLYLVLEGYWDGRAQRELL